MRVALVPSSPYAYTYSPASSIPARHVTTTRITRNPPRQVAASSRSLSHLPEVAPRTRPEFHLLVAYYLAALDVALFGLYCHPIWFLVIAVSCLLTCCECLRSPRALLPVHSQ